jgi:putative CocE/NonD family hydrolase
MLEDLCFINNSLDGTIPKGEKSLTYFTMGKEGFKTTSIWPLENTKYQSLYFRKNNKLSHQKPSVSNKESDTYHVDFSATTGTKNRWATNLGAGQVNYGNRAKEVLKLLVYDTDPLSTDTEITGYPVIELYLKSSHEDGAFFVYLEEVAPDGKVTYITEGLLRWICRQTSEDYFGNNKTPPYQSYLRSDANPININKVTKLYFKLFPTSYLVRKGHNIRVAIAGADKDTFERIPNSGEPIWTILRNKSNPSKIILPIIVQ